MRARQLLIRASAVLLSLAAWPAGAASGGSQALSAQDLARVRNHEAAVVLLRVIETIDGKRVAATRSADTNRIPRFFLASLDALDAPKKARLGAPTPTAAKEGWQHLVLSPGTYFLLLLPPGVEQNPPAVVYSVEHGRYGRLADYAFKPGRGGLWSADLGAYVFRKETPADFQPLAGFWFEVPRDRDVVYVGSLSVTCKAGRGLFGSLIDSCGDFELTAESAAAEALAASALPGLSFDTRLLTPYGSLRPAGHLHDARALPVAAPAAPAVGAALTGARLTSMPVLHGVAPAIHLYNLLVVGGTCSSSLGSATCPRAVRARSLPDRSGALVGLDIGQAFGSALSAAWNSNAGAAGSPLPMPAVAPERSAAQRWSAGLPFLRLREVGPPDSLALELALAVRLENLDSHRLDAFSLLVSGPERPAQDPHAPASPLYLRFVPERATPRPLDAWCGQDGTALLSTDIATALQNIAALLVRDLE
jgi:hypothetical protein